MGDTTGVVRRDAGRNLASAISKTLAKDYYTAIAEFISNSYDADAEHVSVRLESLDDLLIIDDDGTGMDETGIDGFYRMGDSEKVAHPVTPKGRQKIGKFGIATVLLEYLAQEYTLESWKDGQKITIRENFRDTSTEKGPHGVIEEYDPAKHGTRITLRKLNLNRDSFTLDKLKSVLEWEMPSLPDFDIFVNGVLVPKRSVITYCTEYEIDEEVDGVGRVYGSLYYKDKSPLNITGIFIYVNGRAVGNPHAFNLGQYRTALETRAVGMFHADGLEQVIGFDRSRFREDSKEYLAVKAVIDKLLRSVGTDLRHFESSRTYYTKTTRMEDRVNQALHAAEIRLNSAFSAQENPLSFRLEMTYDQEPWMSRYDAKSGIITINIANPQLSVNPLSKVRQVNLLEYGLLLLSISAIADSSAGTSPREEKILQTLAAHTFNASGYLFSKMEKISESLRGLLNQDDTPAVSSSDINLNPYRLYLLEELISKTGLDINTIKSLYVCGVLKAARTGVTKKFRQDQIIPCLQKIDGYVPAGKLIDLDAYTQRTHIARSRPLLALERDLCSDPDLPSYVKNVGTASQPFMWVKRENINDFREYYATKNIN